MLTLLSLVVASARATDADDLIAQGIKLRQDGHDQQALPLFQQAVKQQPSPRAFAQLGTCEQALGLWAGAETHIQESLNHPTDAWVKKNEAPLRRALDLVGQRLGSIEVWGTPPGARVSVDGEAAGTLPLDKPIRASRGQRTIAVEADGFVPENLTVDVSANGLTREHVALRPKTGAATSSPPPGLNVTAPPPGSAPPPPLVDTKPAAATDDRPVYKKWWFWAAAGAVVVAAGTSIVLLTNHSDACQASAGATCTKL